MNDLHPWGKLKLTATYCALWPHSSPADALDPAPFLVLAPAPSAIWAYIADCDETFNYWEPLHYIINGHGLQTWEYSPQFGLRSYTYLLLQGVPGYFYQKMFNPSPILIFYMVRCMLGFACAVMERYMYK